MKAVLLLICSFVNHSFGTINSNITSDGSTYFHWKGKNKPSSSNKVGNIDIDINSGDGVVIDFDINTIKQSSLRNILHIGNNNDERYPSIYVKDGMNVGNDYKYIIDIDGKQFLSPKFLTWDHLTIYFNSSWIYIDWNYGDTIIVNQQLNINVIGIKSKSIYFADPWTDTGNVRIRDLTIDIINHPFIPPIIPTTTDINIDDNDNNDSFKDKIFKNKAVQIVVGALLIVFAVIILIIVLYRLFCRKLKQYKRKHSLLFENKGAKNKYSQQPGYNNNNEHDQSFGIAVLDTNDEFEEEGDLSLIKEGDAEQETFHNE